MAYGNRRKRADSPLLIWKAAVLAAVMTAVLVLLLALSLKWEWLGVSHIRIVNTLIKALSACFAGFVVSHGRYRRLWLVAGLAGVIYIAASFAVFGILNGSFRVSVSNLSDVLMAFACSACTSLIVKTLRERAAQNA